MYDIVSMIPGVAWPAIPDGRASQLLAMQFELEQAQWMSGAELLEHQKRQLMELLRFTYNSVPFYRQRFDTAGLPLREIDSPEAWRRIPLLTRRDVQCAGDAIQCKQIFEHHGPISSSFTSGSSGQPVLTLGTTVTRLFWTAISFRQHLWHPRNLKGKLVSIRSVPARDGDIPKESVFDNWGHSTNGVVNTGPSVTLDVHLPDAEQAELLQRHDPDYLMTYPSVIENLAAYFSRHNLALQRLQEIRTFGEVLEPHTRALCRNVWNVPVVDVYSCQELGYLALQCPKHDHYHVQSETVLLEVLDDEGQPCHPGQVGQVVVTSLHNFAMPLIRYQIGDFAEVGEPCDCGRGLPVLKRIVGRQRNMAIHPSGRRIWPAINLGDAAVAGAIPPISQFQLIQRSLHQMELKLVCPRKLREDERQLVVAWIHKAVGHPFDVEITYSDSIPRGRTGKYEDFRCDVALSL